MRKIQKTSRSNGSNSSYSRIATVGGVPDRTRVTLRYVTNVTLSPSGVTAGSYVFRANGCFDPDVTSTGGQPANFDDFSALYARYRVWGSKLSWVIANNTAGVLDMCTMVVGPRHQSTAITTRAAQENFQAQPYTAVQKTIIYTNGTSSQRGSMAMTTRKFLGLSQTEFEGQDDLAALTSADPAHQFFWQMVICSDDQSSATPHYVNFQIDYDVEFWDRVDTSLDLRVERQLSLRRLKASSDAKKAVELEEKSNDSVVVSTGESFRGEVQLLGPPQISRSSASLLRGRR